MTTSQLFVEVLRNLSILAENEEMFERAAKYLRKLVKEQQQQADPTVDVLSAYGHYDDK